MYTRVVHFDANLLLHAICSLLPTSCCLLICSAYICAWRRLRSNWSYSFRRALCVLQASEAKDYTGAKAQDAKEAAGSAADDLNKKAGSAGAHAHHRAACCSTPSE